MTHTEAEQILAYLASATTGWNNAPDETLRIYLTRLEALRDADAARAAVTELANTWTEARRPPLATVRAAYEAELRRRTMNAPALPAAGHGPVEVGRGRQLAHEAYLAECERQGRKPRPTLVDAFLANTTPKEDQP